MSEKLFADDLPTSVFMTFLEVLKNLKNKKFKHCFSAETRQKSRKHKKMISKLLNPDVREKKRKKLLRNAKQTFKDFCYENVLRNFLDRCVE